MRAIARKDVHSDVLRVHGPLTSAELAKSADVHERYATEWLEQQTVTGLLDVDDATLPSPQRRYLLWRFYRLTR